MKELHQQAAEIETRADLVAFILALRIDLKANPRRWENSMLASFLAALASWTQDMEGYHQNGGRDVPRTPTWKTFGEMLAGARVYE